MGESGARASRRRTRLAAAAAGGSLLAVLSGCAGTPSAGSAHPIEEHVPQAADLDRPYVRLLPPRPQPGDNPDAIMAGFQVAMADFVDGHAAARRYLTPTEARRWDPDSRTLIYTNLQELTGSPSSSGSFAFRVTPVATVARDHGFALDTTPRIYRAKAVKMPDGAWRLSEVGPGSLLSGAEFQRAFRGVDVYFPTVAAARTQQSGGILVPDHVFLPVPPGQLPFAMVRQLVAGPTSWLAPAVSRVAPVGTTVRSVAIDAAGTASVALGGSLVDRLPGERRHLLLAALTWTLVEQLADVKAVRLTIDGAAVGPGPATRRDFSSFDPDAFPSGSRATYVDAGHVQLLQHDGSGEQPGAQPALAGATDPVAPVGARGLAAVRHSRKGDALVLYDGVRWEQVFRAWRVAAPTWMPDGSAVWTIATARDGSQRIIAVQPPSGVGAAVVDPVRVDLAGSGLRHLANVSVLRLSRDGTRLALIVASGRHGVRDARPYIARIDASTLPSVAGLRPMASPCPSSGDQRCITAAIDVAWVDADHVVVLGNTTPTDPETRAPYLVGIDGSSVQPVGAAGLPSNATAITAAPGVSMVAVVPGTGHDEPSIYVQSSDSWTQVGNGYDVRYPD